MSSNHGIIFPILPLPPQSRSPLPLARKAGPRSICRSVASMRRASCALVVIGAGRGESVLIELDSHQLHHAVVTGDVGGIGRSSDMRQKQLQKTSYVVCVIVMIKVNEPDFCDNNLINDNPISDMGASITSKVLRKCFSNLRILQDFSNLFKSSFFQNGILFGQALKIFVEKR